MPCCPYLHSRVQLFETPGTVTLQALSPWDSPGKTIGVGCHALLQRIFLTQKLNIHVCIYILSHFVVEQKLTHCKSAKLKINFLKKSCFINRTHYC